MHSLIQKYMSALEQANAQTNEDRFKHVIMHYADEWDWVNGDSLIADILDDKTITADDIVEMLKSIVEYEGGNREFKYAVMAMESRLRRERYAIQVQLDDIELSDINIHEAQGYDDYREAV
jgi:predicted RNA methylase